MPTYERKPPAIPPHRIAPLRVVNSEQERNTVLRERQKALLVGTLIMKDVAPLTAKYMGQIYEIFLHTDTLTIQEIGECLGLSAEGARYHVTILTELGYLVRVHHRAWELGPKLQEL